MCLQSDGSDRKIILRQIAHKRICRGWRPDYVLSWSIFFCGRLFIGGCLFRKHRMLDVIRTKPWHHWGTPSTLLVFTLETPTVKNLLLLMGGVRSLLWTLCRDWNWYIQKEPQSVRTAAQDFFSAMAGKLYPSAAICLQRADFRLAALFLWMILVFANLSSIFCTVG